MKQSMLAQYARLIVRTGVNLQKGQMAVVRASVDQAPLVEKVVRECYRAGAAHVEVDWECSALDKLGYRHETLTELSAVPAWKEERLKYRLNKLPCMIYIMSDDPDSLKGVNQEKMQKVQQNRFRVTKPYSDAMDNRYQWTIVAAPSPVWAKRIYPSLRAGAAVERLWEQIFAAVGLSDGVDPVEVWTERNRLFEQRCRAINDCHFSSLQYHSENGTDFTVGLIPQADWAGGGEEPLSGVFFNPNLPTEEVFTTPMRGQADGRVVATKPLSCRGQLIEDFWIEFEQGRAVRFDARAGRDVLEKIITSDPGSAMLGELALVPQSSSINRSGILFYNTLFDENASCHIALGKGFTNLIRGYETMTPEALEEMGVNDSMMHVDFMIGTDDMTITGRTEDGQVRTIFQSGEWAL